MTVKNIAAGMLNILAHIIPIPFAALQDQYGEAFEEQYPCKSCNGYVYEVGETCLYCKGSKYQEKVCDLLYTKESYTTELFSQKEV